METALGTYKCVCLQEFRKYRRNESTKSNLISSLVNILAPYPGKGWRVAATDKVDKLEHEDLWALNLDMGNWNNETWHELKNYADRGVSFAPRLNNQRQNQNITEVFSLADIFQIPVAISHQVVVLLFLLCFFFYAKHEDFYFHFLQLYQNSRANTTLSPELFHCIGFFLVISCTTDVVSFDITNSFKIWSMVTWIWRISQGIWANQGWRNIWNE